ERDVGAAPRCAERGHDRPTSPTPDPAPKGRVGDVEKPRRFRNGVQRRAEPNVVAALLAGRAHLLDLLTRLDRRLPKGCVSNGALGPISEAVARRQPAVRLRARSSAAEAA